MSHSLHQTEGGSAAQTLAPNPDDSLPLALREHLQRLRLILPVISVSVMTLHRTNAELDTDIASVLSQHACEPLDCEIEHLASMLASRNWPRRQQGAHT